MFYQAKIKHTIFILIFFISIIIIQLSFFTNLLTFPFAVILLKIFCLFRLNFKVANINSSNSSCELSPINYLIPRKYLQTNKNYSSYLWINLNVFLI